jgi:translation initiation factor IF-2
MSNFETLDRSLLQSVKRAFVAMPAGSGGPGPVAGGGMLTQAQAAPMGGDPAMAGGAPPMDPAAMGGGMPMDPAAMGGMPPGGDPAAMGGDPAAAGGAPPMDPNMLAALMSSGGAGGAPAPAQAPGMITLSVQDLIALMQSGGSKPKAKTDGAGGAAGAGGGDMGAKLDQIISLLGGNMTGGAAPAPGGAPAGGAPAPGAPPQQ